MIKTPEEALEFLIDSPIHFKVGCPYPMPYEHWKKEAHLYIPPLVEDNFVSVVFNGKSPGLDLDFNKHYKNQLENVEFHSFRHNIYVKFTDHAFFNIMMLNDVISYSPYIKKFPEGLHIEYLAFCEEKRMLWEEKEFEDAHPNINWETCRRLFPGKKSKNPLIKITSKLMPEIKIKDTKKEN